MIEEELLTFFIAVACIVVVLTVYNFIILCNIERKLDNKDKKND